MNEHEAERIAAAIHVARPDWPTRSLLTMIQKHLADRPRRDVFVALAWVASEPNTATPARVLEAGPWWRAAGIEGSARPLNRVPVERRCAVCSLDRDQCYRIWSQPQYRDKDGNPDHEFRPIRDMKRDPEAIHTIVEAAKSEKQPTRTADEPAPIPPDPRVDEARAVLHATRGAAQ